MAAIELRHLRYLLAVAEQRSFTYAADELGIAQPTLSQQIKQLERLLGVQLLDRTGRTVRLTDAGEVYATHARQALRDLAAAERAINDVEDLSRGHLRLGATPTFTAYLLGPLVAEFGSRNPGISLTFTEMTQDHIEGALLSDELDLGIAFSDAPAPGISAVSLFTETLSLVTRRPGPQEAFAALSVQALGGLQLALLSGDFATRSHIDAYLAGQRIDPRITVEANSIQALIEIVERTPLATVLPDAITHGHPNLVSVSLDPPLPARTAALLFRQDAYRSAATQAFTELAHEIGHQLSNRG
ncbi:transcriptional regulator CynR [Arthrobacter sp.]|uniref:transcriptional regulator CynR n=1 Tax=Arthrobacter sp. TaxID=1667 RepID=UPI0028A05D0F|nr:transcriptional regulator CynR [Arthrobacter sp.]